MDVVAEWIDTQAGDGRNARLTALLKDCFGGGYWDRLPQGHALTLLDGSVLAAVGFCTLLDVGVASLHTGCVGAAYRGLGLHRRLVRDRLELLRASCCRAYACAHRLNSPALANLRSEGFRECGQIRRVSMFGPDWVTLSVELSPSENRHGAK